MNEFVQRDWRSALAALRHPRVITMLFLGIAAGLPLLLIFSSLSLWLREAGLDRSTVTFFSWAALAYSFKFVWAPLVDRVPVPLLTRLLGRRRGWMLTAQLCVMGAMVWMALTDPATGDVALRNMALAAVALGFSSATQDIVIDAFRIEAADDDLQAMMSATYIAGYRIGMLAAGAGALFIAGYLGSSLDTYVYSAWRNTYLCMAAVMLVGVATTLLVSEPRVGPGEAEGSSGVERTDHGGHGGFVALFVLLVAAFAGTFVLVAPTAHTLAQGLSGLLGGAGAGFVAQTGRFAIAVLAAVAVARIVLLTGLVNRAAVDATYVSPVQEFFARYELRVAALLLALVGLYRISDIVLGVIANVFYQDLGFSKEQIAGVVKTFGLFMTIAGGFVGGIFSVRYGVMRVLFAGALLTVATNLLFVLLAMSGNSEPLLYVVISADNLTAGLASAAFVAFLSSLTNVRFTAVQYAIFSSLMTLLPKLLGGYSGSMVDAMGYVNFFIFASLIGLPVLLLVWLVQRHVELAPPKIG